MGFAIYFTIWWICLFAVLPFGVRSQHEGESYLQGTDPGAPVAPRLLTKALWTTAISAVVFAALWYAMSIEQFGLFE
jgi:predicted secreted protein